MQRTVTRVLKYGVLLSTYGLIGSVLLQIFARFFLENTPPWTEATSRMFFIYATAFAAGLAFKNNYYVHLDVVFDKLPANIQRVLEVIIPALVLLLFGLLTIYAIPFIMAGHFEFSPSMNIRMSFVFFSMFIMGASICYYAWQEQRRQYKRPKP